MFTSFTGRSESYDYRFIEVITPIIFVSIVMFIILLVFHSKYSPIKNWRLKALLIHASSELDLLRHYQSNSKEDPVREIEWQFMYDSTGMLYIKLLPGGHIGKERAQDICRQLTSFLIMKTRKSDEWNMSDSFIDDVTGTINITYGVKRERIIIDTIDSVSKRNGCIQLYSVGFRVLF